MLTSAGFVMLLLQGCFLPSKNIHSAVYRGRIVDAETKQPVAKARIEVRGGFYLAAASNSDSSGAFVVGPLNCWRWYFFVPFGEGKIPGDCGQVVIVDGFKNSLDISRSGYKPASILVPMYGTNWDEGVILGEIALHPEQQR